MPQEYLLDSQKKKAFQGIFLLSHMINTPATFPVVLDGEDTHLEPILMDLYSNELLELQDNRYIPTEKGREKLVKFMERYTEYLKLYDVFCAVDLESGEFAFAEYFDLDEDQWQAHLSDERWEDLRIAVAEFKRLDPVEIVFMSFINEKRFDLEGQTWQFDLASALTWDEILKICSANISWKELGYEEGQDVVSAEEVIRDVITQGTRLSKELIAREKEKAAKEPEDDDGDDENGEGEYYVETVVVVEQPVSYYDSYWADPFYVAPLWHDPYYDPYW